MTLLRISAAAAAFDLHPSQPTKAEKTAKPLSVSGLGAFTILFSFSVRLINSQREISTRRQSNRHFCNQSGDFIRSAAYVEDERRVVTLSGALTRDQRRQRAENSIQLSNDRLASFWAITVSWWGDFVGGCGSAQRMGKVKARLTSPFASLMLVDGCHYEFSEKTPRRRSAKIIQLRIFTELARGFTRTAGDDLHRAPHVAH
jgi:hypothetical protein